MKNINDVMPNDLVRFWSKVKKSRTCWIWKAGKYKNGYGKFWINGLTVLPHRFAYEITKGEISKSLQLDHLCRNRACVNPAHLEIVTSQRNVLRGIGIAAQNNKKNYCDNGHSFSNENCYITPDGRRQCKTCNAIRQQKYRNKLKKELKID